ncbi:glycosyltransferase family 2 protein [Methylomonas methanica]|uniref:Glycosyl transferase family 2 n=1 Tax=Methylomonas methanica (strain DSM 25384 / MC09) TaxID=857087 RepID=F9ZW61_METMM|nr:glycosyltransferase [Methylomonas methanica]AEG02032.1 glycosyl transferase family 2 [Methylomonas methanica MC09]
MIRLSIILPCYNEGETLGALVDGYRRALAGRGDVELILVDNGSTDDTARQIAREIATGASFVFESVSVPHNRGYGHGILCGLAKARGSFLAWSHADLQCPPADVIRLFDAVLAHPEPHNCFGKGHRVNDRGRAGLLTRLQTLLSQLLLGQRLVEINAQPKLFHRSLLNRFHRPPIGYELDIYAYYKAVRAGLSVVSIPVQFLERQAGRSKWAFSLPSRLRFMARNLWYLLTLRLNGERI